MAASPTLIQQTQLEESLTSSTKQSNDTATEPAGAVAVPMRIEVVIVPVADIERAKSS